jgi:hypothetical protein
MAKWWEFTRRAKESRNGKRFYSSRDMSEIKRMESVRNSRVKRGETDNKHKHICVCGCGAEGCFLIV